MNSQVRFASACAMLLGCSAVGAPSPGEPAGISSVPAPATRVSTPKARVDTPVETKPPAAPTARTVVEPEQRDDPPVTAAPLELVATAREAFVHVRPSRRSPRLGYLRLGARLRRDPSPTPGDGCPGGWYGVAPEGYVCAGATASLDAANPAAELARPRPERDDPLPYVYARSKGYRPPLYTRLPKSERTGTFERPVRSAPGWDDVRDTELPGVLAEGRSLPTVFGYSRAASSLPEHAVPNSAFALLSTHEHEGRRFGLTTELELVPLDLVKPVRPSEFRGVALGPELSLPVVFVRSRRALLYGGSPERGLAIARPLVHREALAVTGRSAFIAGRRYLETRTGDWLLDAELVHIDAPTRLPPWASGTRTWIHVAVATQTLVAYVGKDPVYATLVSTGAGAVTDSAASLATPRGEFLVHTKHVTATMSGEDVGDEYDLGDVPYVQYWSGGYAFHAAYWHDAFGTPKSHGCVNLSPIDARWLFHFTEPHVPRSWHGAFSLRDGTLVSITE